MAEALIRVLAGEVEDEASGERGNDDRGVDSSQSIPLFITSPIADFGAIDGVMFSGGVAEYVYGRESRDFGDLGRALGRVLARRIEAGALAWPMLPPGECIRATVLGAAEHTVQLSGQTIFISNHAALLPRRNLPVVRPDIDLVGDIDAAMVADAIRAHRAAFDLAASDPPIALAFRWRGAPEHRRVRALAEGIVAGMADHIARGTPLYLMLEGDAALTLGGVLREELALSSELVVIDGVVLRDFDFVDIGRMRLPSHTVPVTIKSLLFGAAHTR
jgi:ethanolamine utilization protein EutA